MWGKCNNTKKVWDTYLVVYVFLNDLKAKLKMF